MSAVCLRLPNRLGYQANVSFVQLKKKGVLWKMLSKEKIKEYLDQMATGISIEDINPKLELKRQWPNFIQPDATEKKKKESEFLKDIVAMANTPGPTGYLIFGIGEDGNLYDGKFSTCGLTDQTQLRGIVVKRVSPPVNFSLNHIEIEHNGTSQTISVIEIPASLEKPHVISNYLFPGGKDIDQYIPIRKTGGIVPAGHYDIEHMFYDRKNIEPEYAINILAHEPGISFNDGTKIIMDLTLVIENFGRKPVGIISSTLRFVEETQDVIANDLFFNLIEYGEWNGNKSPIRAKYLVIPSNTLVPLQLKYELSRNLKHDQGYALEILRGLREIKFSIILESIIGQNFSSGILKGWGTFRR